MTQNNVRIQGRFYPLQHEEWLKAYKELTDSQRNLLYYLQSLDLYGNGLRIHASKITNDLDTCSEFGIPVIFKEIQP
ncbi:MAG: hypothetical protein KME28_25165 [Pelatocladus maniniholoensis HA4357-MV3]|jgi:hypothetical protein|uniref:Uncharacterized protein n=1 Tax=Pelatocladus maniniholoensis HA4357-MV3 TaxID=1117104 RepID=A0A9E3HCS3_9NOST|nr:hypothetical protein [Pelatocladus maniniholoensis HA4357-MV3]BAZ71049.1 hypothetical protein NIES4106_58460 [Fischerella sp. NIES-4106]